MALRPGRLAGDSPALDPKKNATNMLSSMQIHGHTSEAKTESQTLHLRLSSIVPHIRSIFIIFIPRMQLATGGGSRKTLSDLISSMPIPDAFWGILKYGTLFSMSW